MDDLPIRLPASLAAAPFLMAILTAAACSSSRTPAPLTWPASRPHSQGLRIDPLTVPTPEAPPQGQGRDYNILVELSATPRDGAEDDLYGIGVYGELESGWGGGIQLHATFEQTDPEVQPFFGMFTSEIAPRTTEFVVDLVGTRRVNRHLSLFAGAGVSTRERYRRFLDDQGNDFFVRVNRNVRGNFTAGAHIWLFDHVTLSAQYDSAFEAATFALGWKF